MSQAKNIIIQRVFYVTKSIANTFKKTSADNFFGDVFAFIDYFETKVKQELFLEILFLTCFLDRKTKLTEFFAKRIIFPMCVSNKVGT